MTVWVRLVVEGQATTHESLMAGVAYLDAHPHIVEWSYNDQDLLLYGTTPHFPWEPNPPAPDPPIADPPPVVEDEPDPPPPVVQEDPNTEPPAEPPAE